MATNENLIPIPGRLHSVATEGHVAGADEIYDDALGKLQSEVNASKADLVNGKVPSEQLPSYVDDVINGYYYNGSFYKEVAHTTEITGEEGKIYVDIPTDKSYRWSGSAYILISNPYSVDEEDLTVVNNNIKFKDRPNTDGMGMVILRKNMVSGVNTLTQSMMQATNTIYVIQYDFTLGENLTIPDNCVLEFDGGSINGSNTVTLGTTKCFGFNGIHCPITSNYPIRTSLCGIGTEWESDSSERLSALVDNHVKIIVDTNIQCLSPVYSNAKRFYFVGDYSCGYRRPAYSISFPNTDGFVLRSGTGEPTTDILFGHCFRNLNIISEGTCINFWPTDHIGVFAENTFENLYLESVNGDCVNYGDNFTSVYQTAGFNQYFRQIQAKALNGVCFRNVRGNILIWEHITIYGSKDGGWYDCNGYYKGCIFDQSSYVEYGWRWEDRAISSGTISFEHCHFESMKHPIKASAKYSASFYINGLYADENPNYDTVTIVDDQEVRTKEYNHIDFGNASRITINNLSAEHRGGDYAPGYGAFACNSLPQIIGQGIPIVYRSNTKINLPGNAGNPLRFVYSQDEYGKRYGLSLDTDLDLHRFKADMISLKPLKYEELTWYSYNYISNNCALGRTLMFDTLTNNRNFDGFSGFQMPYDDSRWQIFEFDIINNSTYNLTIRHRNNTSGTHLFNCFTGDNIVLAPGESAHCVFNCAQTKGAIVSNKYLIEVVRVNKFNIVAGSTRPTNPYIGQQFFDSTSGIKKPIWWNGSTWVDATGTTV